MVIGERSPGTVLGTKTDVLPNGVFFVYPNRQYILSDGTVLEDHGVIPDIETSLDRRLLLEGIDSQLDAAISYLEGEIRE